MGIAENIIIDTTAIIFVDMIMDSLKRHPKEVRDKVLGELDRRYKKINKKNVTET